MRTFSKTARRTPPSALLALGGAGLLAACAARREFFAPERAADQRAAGSVHVVVLAVAPWSHYESALQPDFHLSGDEARQQVVRDTASGYESSTRSLGLGAGVTQDPDQHGITPAPGTSSFSQSFLAGPSLGRPDAMLEYWSAAALFQEVQMLNRSVRDAAIPAGYRAYVVRLQVSLLPRRRNEPYDAYTTLSFFAPSPTAAERAGEDGGGAAGALAYEPAATSLRSGSAARDALLPGTGPCVLPLVVTDNLEASQQGRASQDTQNLALAFLAFPGQFATDVTADLFQDQLQAQLNARDLNSLLTVARLSENSLRVRLGAMQQASAKFAMVPRNHYVTLLLMVPEDALPVIDLVAQTVLVDTDTGEELAGTSEAGIDALFAGVRARAGRPELDDATLRALFALVQKNDQRGYQELLSARLPAGVEPALLHELWIELVQLMVGSQFTAHRFELPGHGQWDIQPEEFYAQTPLAVDDGSLATRIALHGARFGERVALTAMLHLAVNGREVTLPADSIERAERELRLAFPSLAALGLAESAQAGLALHLRWAGEEARFDALYVRRAPAPQSP
jgi:hypothetical protein